MHSSQIILKYTECSCTASGEGIPGVCGTQCPAMLWGSIVITSIGTILNFAGFAAHAIIYQRVVSEVDRTMAQGLRQTATRLLGTLPSPLIFGWLLDQTCVVWKKTEDGTVGNCWIYDIDKYVRHLTLTRTIIQMLCRYNGIALESGQVSISCSQHIDENAQICNLF